MSLPSNAVTDPLGLNDESPAKAALLKTSQQVTIAMLLILVLTGFLIVVFSILKASVSDVTPFFAMFMTELSRGVLLIITILFVGTPSQLIFVLSVAKVANELTKIGILTRNLQSIEKLDGITDILAEKSGVLTEDRMTVRAAYINGTTRHGNFFDGVDNLDLIKESIVINSKADRVGFSGHMTYKGTAIEAGQMKFLDDNNLDWRDQMIQRRFEVVYEIPFNSRRKRQLVAFKRPSGEIRVLVKGASEIILYNC